MLPELTDEHVVSTLSIAGPLVHGASVHVGNEVHEPALHVAVPAVATYSGVLHMTVHCPLFPDVPSQLVAALSMFATDESTMQLFGSHDTLLVSHSVPPVPRLPVSHVAEPLREYPFAHATLQVPSNCVFAQFVLPASMFAIPVGFALHVNCVHTPLESQLPLD